ncbi:hypothetical protein GN958_ATG11744 [Phytophthora infestans]|uniref:DUF6604 domain-containing protein n=1 Tax=Phytophthora infestans TaxID=4787 RepID=A0A8S9UI16_PHYIN|nr:hypothetical protein GN958_ATG11744 [Phytophthora infestans]
MFSSRAFDGFLNVEPACSSEAHRVESENLKINSGQSTKKKKKKNNKKRKNRNKGNNAGDEATETATTEKDDVAEVTKMLQQPACQCAITLRERVAAFFADSEHGHEHFLEQLRSWYNTRKEVEVEPGNVETAVEVESSKFENYYEALEVDEDYFPDEDTYVPEPSAPTKLRVDRQKVLEEAFAEDMRLEVVYFFVELEELGEKVFEMYKSVKKQQRTMLEATVVTKLAIDTANSLTATLQLRYPSLQTAGDFRRLVFDPEKKRLGALMTQAMDAAWDAMIEEKVYKPATGQGMFLADFFIIATTLKSFSDMIPPSSRYRIDLPPGFYGENYDEERTPEYLLAGSNGMVTFLLQNLSELYNTLIFSKVTTASSYDTTAVPDWGLAGSFLTAMDKYFTSHEIEMSTVFVCLCWIKSAGALQGDGGLSRNTSLTLKHTADLLTRINVCVAKGAVKAADKELQKALETYAQQLKRSALNDHLAAINPLVAGLTMLDHHLEYLDLARFFEDILDLYGEMIFTPSRAAAVRGAYYRTFLLSSDLKATALDAAIRGNTPASVDSIKVRPIQYLNEMSKIFRLMTKNDTSFLEGVSSKGLLDKAADICSHELFDTRVLSRDMLKLNDDLSDAFSEMYSALDERRVCFLDGMAVRVTQTCDCLRPNDAFDIRALPGCPYPGSELISDELAIAMCKKIAAVIETKFDG